MNSTRDVFAIGLLVFAFVGSACAGDESAKEPSCAQLFDQVDSRMYDATGEVAGFAPEDQSTFVVKAVNGSSDNGVLTLTIDGENEIDMEIPGSDECSHPPVLTFGFDQPAGEAKVTAQFGDLSSADSVIVREREPTWLVVQASDEQLKLSVWNERPVFG